MYNVCIFAVYTHIRQSEGVAFKRISSVDFSPPDHSVLDEAADFIDYNLKQKKVVYIHCKSGIGRSASGLVAYLVKHRGMPVHTAVAYVRSKRPNIFSQSSRQMQNLINYEIIIKQKKQTSFVNNAEP
jgi:protein-tyrosine phosphatase